MTEPIRLPRAETERRADEVLSELASWFEEIGLKSEFAIDLATLRVEFDPEKGTLAYRPKDEPDAPLAEVPYCERGARNEIILHVPQIMEAAESQAGLVPTDFAKALLVAERLLGLTDEESDD